jgi:apoptosis-inducing factor 3
MSESNGEELSGPDLRNEGAAMSEIVEGGMLAGHFDGDPVLLVRKNGAVLAMGGKCTHYGAPLGDGIFDGELVHCPWHHACFRPETGEAVHAPAIDPAGSFNIEQRGDRVFVTGAAESRPERAPIREAPASVVIIGGGAAGLAAAEMLRREGYGGPITMVSSDKTAPYDRPNVSKDYLAGNAEEEWMPLRSDDWYEQSNIELVLESEAVELNTDARRVRLDSGRELEYGALLLATGATPVRLGLPGEELPHVHFVRSMEDSQAIIERAGQAQRAVVVGASFIGLEVAASLRNRELEVHVVAPESTPMELVLGREFGSFIRDLHEEHGVQFHLGQTVKEIHRDSVTLQDGSTLQAELVVFGVGVRPNLQLAERAGLSVDRGVVVDEYLRTSADGVWAAGDIARWPDRYSGERIRVEHWVVAERQGQTAARNMLGRNQRFDAAPFFWSQHYDVPINYVGHAQGWDAVTVSGSIPDRDCVVAYRKSGKPLAIATIYRDGESLQAEVAMERGDVQAIEGLL